MAAMVHPADAEEPEPQPPRLQAVPPLPAEVSTVGHGIVKGAILGWIGVALAATLLGVAGGMSLRSAAGFAAMVAVFGGLGFGAMLGGTVAFTRDLANHPAPGPTELLKETGR